MGREPGRTAHDIDELKQFVVVHSRAQRLPPELCEEVLARIGHDGEGPGSWTEEWAAAARKLAAEDRLLDASQCWNTARFPYVDGTPRARAQQACSETFAQWSGAQETVIERVDVTLPDGDGTRLPFVALAAGLSADVPRPLLVVTGGIVSVKEQWAPALLLAEQLGLAMVATEMPGVGENRLGYGKDSWRMLSALLDTLADRADVDRTYASAMSFSGHMALRGALHDPRIRGVVTAGAPVSGFFTDRSWYDSSVPRITKDTLSHLTGVPRAELFDGLRDWELRPGELSALSIPVGYTVSLRDEIIPPSDVRTLKRYVSDLTLNEHDDVHGSPAHVEETRAWTVQTVLKMMRAAASPQA
ncbi:alpha/beta hydrolase [Streptomyces sp. GESEQ-35]|uniref:alpha/beta hydrolase n=1 Tax=Streptomyces sp. GESEQ-35 TaxID=2812657 RepID=UPI001B31F122|nr:alpha/beta hydrolase [Streptomyces sp. GESEQ-35]